MESSDKSAGPTTQAITPDQLAAAFGVDASHELSEALTKIKHCLAQLRDALALQLPEFRVHTNRR